MTNKDITVTPRQYTIIQTVFFGGMSFFLYPELVASSTNQAYWIPVLFWFLISLFGAYVYSKMMKPYPRKNIVEISILLIGRKLSFLLLFPLLLFWFNSVALMIRAHAELVNMTMLTMTPTWVLSCLFVIPLIGAIGGITSIVRTLSVYSLICVPLVFGITILGFQDLDYHLGKPWFDSSIDFLTSPEFYASSYIWVGFIYCGIIGKYTEKVGELWKSYFWATLCFLPIVFTIVLFPILTFGPEMTQSITFPYVLKMASVDNYYLIVESLTAVYISSVMIYVIGTISFIYYCIGKAIHDFFPKWEEKKILFIIGGLSYMVALLIPSWDWLRQGVVIESPLRLFVAFLLPLTIIGIHSWKKRRQSI
ncbi:GerAB/ArcD/ProY family transporter [Terrihalobacillus insolitus]|uniref:GerAB/ArcD/ProY family transporter n=1 Tax=Terrihalobacillus insolitus TaxID=2950438 RepID=UPI00233F9DF2|nr:GerAB/ArcD/ProY family transporter [Terrihalobacillus insolitus]MDC3412929.1 spore germination protein [Terrihalobacillus insolitus]